LCGSVPLFRLMRSWSPQGEFTFMLLEGFCCLALELLWGRFIVSAVFRTPTFFIYIFMGRQGKIDDG
jgi:hypothetical protein